MKMKKSKKTATSTNVLYDRSDGYGLEEIRWYDHFSLQSKIWYTRDEIEDEKEQSEMVSVGLVIGEDKDHVVLSLSASRDGLAFKQPFFLLKKNIISRKKLK